MLQVLTKCAIYKIIIEILTATIMSCCFNSKKLAEKLERIDSKMAKDTQDFAELYES